MRDWSEYPPMFLILKHLQAMNPSFVIITKSLRNKTGETLCERWKCMCKLFEINGQKDF